MNLREYIFKARIGDIINAYGTDQVVMTITTLSRFGYHLNTYEIQISEIDDARNFFDNPNGEQPDTLHLECSSSSECSEIVVLGNLLDSKTNMSTISQKIKKLIRTEPNKTFVKAGFMDENENVTEDGRLALNHILWNANEAKLKALADNILKEDD